MCILKKKLEMTELKKFRVNSKGLEFIESAVENVITGVNFFLLPKKCLKYHLNMILFLSVNIGAGTCL
jgi:hypothetical protein